MAPHDDQMVISFEVTSSAYHAMRSSGFITLLNVPCMIIHNGLRDVRRKLLSSCLIKVNLPQNLKACVAVAFDEVKVKERIVYDKHCC